MAAFKQSTLQSSTGASLNLLYLAPKGKARAVVQINHGMGEHAARYERFAKALTQSGYAVYAHDHRGHGFTKAPDAPLGQFAAAGGFAKVLADVDAVNDHIRAQHPGLPVIVFGHSMGSVIALSYALHHPDKTDGLAAWNTGLEGGALALVFRTILNVQTLFKGRAATSQLVYNLTFAAWNRAFAPNRTDFDWLSRDEAEVDKYISDPLCGFEISMGLWRDLLGALHYGARNDSLATLPKSLPVHLLGGALDACTDGGKHMQNLAVRLRAAGLSDVEISVLNDTRHESLNELNRDQTTADFIGWLDARFGG